MKRIIYGSDNGFEITNDDEILKSVVSSLKYNNTFCPNVRRVIYNLGKSTDGSNVLATTVYFADNSKVTVKNVLFDEIHTEMADVEMSDGKSVKVEVPTQQSCEIGLMYALCKRLVCKCDDDGNLNGSFLTPIQNIMKSAYYQNVEEVRTKYEKNLRKEKYKNELNNRDNSNKKVKRPSLFDCVNALSDVAKQLAEVTNKFTSPSKKK